MLAAVQVPRRCGFETAGPQVNRVALAVSFAGYRLRSHALKAPVICRHSLMVSLTNRSITTEKVAAAHRLSHRPAFVKVAREPSSIQYGLARCLPAVDPVERSPIVPRILHPPGRRRCRYSPHSVIASVVRHPQFPPFPFSVRPLVFENSERNRLSEVTSADFISLVSPFIG